MTERHRLRVMLANERADRLEVVAKVVRGLGHEVVAREFEVADVAGVTARERPDVALVGLGDHPEHALELVSEIVSGAFCPVIAYLRSYDAEWVKRAAALGIYAYIVDTGADELQSAMEITLQRYAAYHELQGAFERRDRDLHRERRRAIALHEGVVQSLTVAGLALELEKPGVARDSVQTALENVRGVITSALLELREQGLPLTDALREATPPRA